MRFQFLRPLAYLKRITIALEKIANIDHPPDSSSEKIELIETIEDPDEELAEMLKEIDSKLATNPDKHLWEEDNLTEQELELSDL